MSILSEIDLAIRQLDKPAAMRARAEFARRIAGTAADPPAPVARKACAMIQHEPPITPVACTALPLPSKPGGAAVAAPQPASSPPRNDTSPHPNTEPHAASLQPGQIVEAELVGTASFTRSVAVPVLWEGLELWLLRRPHNHCDPNAIAAYRRCGKPVGYIDRDLAAELASTFDGYGLPVPSTITGLTNGDWPLGIRIQFSVPQTDPDAVASASLCDQSDLPAPARATNGDPSLSPLVAEATLEQSEQGLGDRTLAMPELVAKFPPAQEARLNPPSCNGSPAEIMAQAATELRWAAIQYEDAWGSFTERQVVPLARFTGNGDGPGWSCWCSLRSDFRTFLDGRVLAAELGPCLSPQDAAYPFLVGILPQIRARF